MMHTLTDAELDAVSAGQGANAFLNLAALFAAGPATATVTADGVTVSATTVGGLSPANLATVSGVFTATSG